MKSATSMCQKHFIDSFVEYLDAVVQQARDRDDKSIRTIESYFTIRRGDVGTRPCYALLELSLNIPDEVINHPVIRELSDCASDLVALNNVSPHHLLVE